jgi:periplasmic protein TonB
MSHDLFTEVVSPTTRVRSRSRATLAISIIVHAVIVAAVVIVPLMATNVLPAPASGAVSFIVAQPMPPNPPPPAPPAAAPKIANAEPYPIEEPPPIVPEDPTPPAPAGDAVVGSIDLGPSASPGFGPGIGVGKDVEPPPAPAPVPAPLQKPLRVSDGVRAPTKIRHVAPIYPQVALTARVSGRVVIDAVIGTDGAVRETRVLQGAPLLNQAALDAVRQWRYTPTLLNGQPVPVIMTVTVEFKLQ